MRSNMIWWQTPDWLRGIPWCCTAFPDTQYPPWLPAPSNHSASDSKADSWEAGFWEDHLHCGVPPPKAPHPLCKGTNPSFAPPDLFLYALPYISMTSPHPKFLHSRPSRQVSSVTSIQGMGPASGNKPQLRLPGWSRSCGWLLASLSDKGYTNLLISYETTLFHNLATWMVSSIKFENTATL